MYVVHANIHLCTYVYTELYIKFNIDQHRPTPTSIKDSNIKTIVKAVE